MKFRMPMAVVYLLAGNAIALPVHHFEPTASVCASIDSEMNKATSRLRSEHSTREGAYLKQQLQDLREKRSICQRAGLKTYFGD